MTTLGGHNKALFQPSEPPDQRDGEVVAVDEMAGCDYTGLVQMERVSLQDMRGIRIGQGRVDCVKICK